MRGATLRDHGGAGPPAVLVPSLINPPRILDLDEEVSLTARHRAAWAGARCCSIGARRTSARELSVAGHVEELLLPLLRSIGEPAALIGYCLGGTMAIAAANLVAGRTRRDARRAVGLLALSGRVAARRSRTCGVIRTAAAESLGALPMEVLQAAFWSLDPAAHGAQVRRIRPARSGSAEARRFVELEEWANEGEPLPYPAARNWSRNCSATTCPGSGAGRSVAAP